MNDPLYTIVVTTTGQVRLVPGLDFTPDDMDAAAEAVGAVQDTIS